MDVARVAGGRSIGRILEKATLGQICAADLEPQPFRDQPATRARLDPQLVLGVIEVESGFRKYAVSRSGARGYMQVMPFWVKLIGQPGHNLFHLRTNLAYGCAILRYYLDIEKGDYFRALGRYNGSLGKPQYPNLVLSAWRGRWKYDGPTA